MTGQLDQLSKNLRPNNELSDYDEPDLQPIFIVEVCQHWLNQMRLIKLKQAKIKYKPKIRIISVRGFLRNSINETLNVLGIPIQSICWITMKSMSCTYDFSYFQQNHLTNKVQLIHLMRWFNLYNSSLICLSKSKELHDI